MTPPCTLAGIDVDDDLVVLDVIGDAYHCVPGAGAAWRDLRAGRRSPDALELAEGLRDAGLVTPPELPVPHAMPQRGLAGPAQPTITRADAWRLLRAWFDLRRDYVGHPFHRVLSAARTDLSVAQGDPDDPELHRLVAVFLHAAAWIPADRKCLVRSFLLLRFLQRSGRDADWVFGVRTWPFVAHCWLQVGDRALDEDPERLEAYTPIHVA